MPRKRFNAFEDFPESTPEDVQVYQHQVFFLHDGWPLPPRYGYTNRLGRQVALAGTTAFQV